MINAGVYCENQRDIVIEALSTAEQEIVIAVAWINFDEYGGVIGSLLQKGISIRIIVNDDNKNTRYETIVNNLQKVGLQFKRIRMIKNTSYMHHKFCVIDRKMCMMGSFNWTKNANENNLEDLSVSYDSALINGFVLQFETIWSLSVDDLMRLRKPDCCQICGQPKANLCVFVQEGYWQTKVDIYEVCGCDGAKWISSQFFDISVYATISGIFTKYSDLYEENCMSDGIVDLSDRTCELDYEMSSYLSAVRIYRMNCPIIHAVGIYGWKSIYKNDGESIIQVLWKERYSSDYVMDIYTIG